MHLYGYYMDNIRITKSLISITNSSIYTDIIHIKVLYIEFYTDNLTFYFKNNFLSYTDNQTKEIL